MPDEILIRYGEIALKGKNRRFFENALLHNLKVAVRGLPVTVRRAHGRFFAAVEDGYLAPALDRLHRVFGTVSASAVTPASLDMESICAASIQVAASLPGSLHTFKIQARRPNKQFSVTSPEINRRVGEFLLDRIPRLSVDLHRPDFTIYIEIAADRAYIYHDSARGPGGLPVGVTGRSMLLLSGGIDSPVAGWMAMKRGLALEALHFHSFPFTGVHAREKVIDLCRILAGWGGSLILHQVNVAGVQQAIRAQCPEELGIILLRRMMLRIADTLCRERNIGTLTTGESLGQVASQTLESMTVIAAVTDMLILRPLLAMDKHEIITVAERIETYPVSIRPFEDCCTLFVPRHPVTRPAAGRVERAESVLDTDHLRREALNSLESRTIRR